jgi:uncharacterized membrane protein
MTKVTKARGWTDQRTELVIGDLLRWGVILSALVVVLGGTVYLVRHGMEPPSYGVFRGEPRNLRNVEGILGQVRAWRGRGIIQLGLLLLIATPVARVAFSVVAFALERDRLYVGITLIVLAVLAFSLAGGHF